MFCTLYGVWGDDFLRKFFFLFILFLFIFICCLCFYCSINVKRQSELSGLRPDTSSSVYFEIQKLKVFSRIKSDVFLFICVQIFFSDCLLATSTIVFMRRVCTGLRFASINHQKKQKS